MITEKRCRESGPSAAYKQPPRKLPLPQAMPRIRLGNSSSRMVLSMKIDYICAAHELNALLDPDRALRARASRQLARRALLFCLALHAQLTISDRSAVIQWTGC